MTTDHVTTDHVGLVESAMVQIRRSQRRRSLAHTARKRNSGPATVPDSVVEVLDVLEFAATAGAAATVSTVAAALSVDQPRASRLVASAVDAGFVRRVADQADGRRVTLVPTAAGRALTRRVHEFRRSMFAAAMADWSAAERREFARLLTLFVERLTDGRDA